MSLLSALMRPLYVGRFTGAGEPHVTTAPGRTATGAAAYDRSERDEPPNKARALFIFDVFNRHVAVQSASERPSDIDVGWVPEGVPADTATIERRRRRVFQFPNALLAAWSLVKPRLLHDYESRRPLHAIWLTREPRTNTDSKVAGDAQPPLDRLLV
jgi:hypothetical protein